MKAELDLVTAQKVIGAARYLRRVQAEHLCNVLSGDIVIAAHREHQSLALVELSGGGFERAFDGFGILASEQGRFEY